jgi:hypothetical protein
MQSCAGSEITIQTTLRQFPERTKLPDNSIDINNAGLVLCGVFLPPLFQKLDMLEDNRLRDIENTSHAVHLLQYLVDGRADAAEEHLALNKILCGVAPQSPINAGVSLTDQERGLCEQLLKSLITNWNGIGEMSIAGLQESFLRRRGRLNETSEGWSLRVERRPFDILLSKLPWSYSTIALPWMAQPLHVKW